jgi:hypothetical protein
MSYKIKTLIVFDTNSLRSTDAGEVAYSFFAFGRPFQVIENFIVEKNLADDIHIAIPTWAIEELKDQKYIQYNKDIIDFQKLAKRLSGMPHIPEITLPQEEFDCTVYIQVKATEYLESKSIKLLGIKEEIANTVLQSMMTRVMKEERVKQPFVHAKKGNKTYKDAGFKDNLIWESLLHFQDITNYDKVIFVTQDSDYNASCTDEFMAKWNKHFSIITDENNVIVEIQKDYGNYIAERAIFEFAQTEYFKDYLRDELKVKTSISINDDEFNIENFSIPEICKKVDRLLPNEDEVENISVSSEIKIFYTANKEKKEQHVTATTLLWDDETKEIMSTEFDFDLI